jgi:dihydroorotate dehydrogenase electron transfer subunit
MMEIINPVYTNAVKKVSGENYRVKTIEIEHAMENALPGQFVMVWMPAVGERPMSIGNSYPLTISVANVGKVSAAITSLKKGDRISYRGPFGKPFAVPNDAKRVLVIGGGYGIVPLYFLARRAHENGIETVAVLGSRTVQDLIYEKQLLAVCKEVFVTTDDGTRGKKGTVMTEAQWLVESKKFDCVYVCGPEMMMRAVALICKQHRVPCQVSLERYMKCGMGVCGSCVINGKTVCRDGPVFSGEEALALVEFGKPHRDATGRIVGK